MSYNLEQHSGLNAVVAVATAGANLTGLTGAATTHSTSQFGFTIDGVCYTKAAASAAATPTVDFNTNAPVVFAAGKAKARAFAWIVDSAGTTRVVAGPEVDNVAGAVCPYPSIPAGHAVIAVHTVAASSSLASAWTFGSSNWNVSGITVGTVYNTAGSLPGFALTV